MGSLFRRGDSVSASHILVQDEAVAREILAQLQGGADFASLARKHSICPSKENGGSLGSFTRGRMVREFEEAAFALQPGDLSGLVKTKFGYHIIRRTA